MAPWRWKDGDAALPPLDGLAIVELSIGGTLPYPLAEQAPPPDVGRMAGTMRVA